MADLPGSEARRTEQVSTRLNANIFIVLCANLAELERGAHLTVEFILLLGDPDVVLGSVLYEHTEIGRHARLAVRVQVTTHTHVK